MTEDSLMMTKSSIKQSPLKNIESNTSITCALWVRFITKTLQNHGFETEHFIQITQTPPSNQQVLMDIV